jgi:FAD dependent oxidoreductase TIGR03364
MGQSYDDAVVGAGILGLAHAYHLAKRGRRVAVFERNEKACGASIRNFGMIWPIGQPAGAMHRMAMRSREIWLEVLQESGIWHERVGSLHLAYHEDEAQVVSEFVREAGSNGYDCALLPPGQVALSSPMVRQNGLLTALWSPTEVCVDPRQAIAELPRWLHQRYGVEFFFGCAVTGYDSPCLQAGGREWRVQHLYVCPGDDTQTLFPDILQSAGMIRCKLQMLRSQPYPDRRMGPMLAAGLTLRHYKSFEICPSLPALRRRVADEMPEYERFGIHVMASQHGSGELTIGDSHEYGEEVTPFDNPAIDSLILNYLHNFLEAPDLQIASRWHGIYAKHPTQPFCIFRPSSTVTLVTGAGGAGMTLSFGLAEQVLNENQI